jgi:hypothetical protein
MATSNYSWNLPTVGGSEDAWGTQLNANWTALDTLLGGVSQAQLNQLDGNIFTGNLTVDTNTLFVDAANNRVGVGTSSPAAKLEVTGDALTTWEAASTKFIGSKFSTSYDLGMYMDTDNRKLTLSAKAADALGTIAFETGVTPTERMRVTNEGRVGIGASSPNELLHVNNSSQNSYVYMSGGGGLGETYGGFVRGYGVTGEGGHLQLGVVDANAKRVAVEVTEQGNEILFSTAGAESLRINASGNVGIGTTSSAARLAVVNAQQGNFGSRQIYIEDSTASVSQPGIGFHASANSTAGIIKFYGPSSQFEIRNSTDTGFSAILASAFVVSSDYRLKENIVPLVGACDRLKQIPVHRFNFKPFEETGVEFQDRTVDGFLAHEVQSVVPEAITGEKDAVDGAGKPVYQGVDQSKLVPLLTAALQEALARIETLEAEVAALKGAS